MKTEAERNKFYGKDAAEWLRRWDAGETVWSVEMGGLGPGYEQAIQITVAEVLRFVQANDMRPETWTQDGVWSQVYESIHSGLRGNAIIGKLGLSGAQFGAAVRLASALAMRGPAAVHDELYASDPSRCIQVCKEFPHV